jgi:hypothetical protein
MYIDAMSNNKMVESGNLFGVSMKKSMVEILILAHTARLEVGTLDQLKNKKSWPCPAYVPIRGQTYGLRLLPSLALSSHPTAAFCS